MVRHRHRVVPIAARAYVVQERGRLRLLDVTDPEQPVDLGGIGPPDVADAAAADGRLFIVTGDGRFGHMEPVGTLVGALDLPPPQSADDRWRILTVADGLAYLATYQGSELHLVGVTAPDRPVLRGSAMPGGRVWRSPQAANTRMWPLSRSTVLAATPPTTALRSSSWWSWTCRTRRPPVPSTPFGAGSRCVGRRRSW